MNRNWTEHRLGDVTTWSSGGTPSKKNEAYWNGDIPWISASSMAGNRYSDSANKITLAGLNAGSKEAKKDSILLLVRGSILHQKIPVGIAEKDVSFNQDVKCLVADETQIEPWFLLFWFMANERKLLNMVESTGIGAGKLDTKQLQDLVIKLPEKAIRNKITSILKALDDKIILNNQINKTLEEMAQAIFKSWFVDFEPTKAKIKTLEAGGTEDDAERAAMTAISGKNSAALDAMATDQPAAYAQLQATAALFPAAMTDSELGPIPEGWNAKPLDDIAHYQNGLALQKFRPKDETDFLPVVKIAQLKKGFADGEEKASPDIKESCIIDDGDVIFSWSGSLVVDLWCGGKAALNQHLFKVTSDEYPKWFYFYFTKHHLNEFQRIAADKAVTMGHIKREHLSAALCAIPGTPLMDLATLRIASLVQMQINQRIENKKLAQILDTLLPKLLSGEIDLEGLSDD